MINMMIGEICLEYNTKREKNNVVYDYGYGRCAKRKTKN